MRIWISLFIFINLLLSTTHTYAMESRDYTHLKGINVSHWDGNIDWSEVSKSGINFAYLKATDGTSNVDSQLEGFAKDARANSIAVGAFHYAKPTAPFDQFEPVNQAIFFVNAMKSSMTDYGDIMPVLDLEESGGLSPNELSLWARSFTNTVKQLTHRQVMIYISEDFLKENGYLNRSLSDLPLWVAYWDQFYNGQNPPDIAGWNEWTAWQYSNSGIVPGITKPVDVNAGPLTLAALRGSLVSLQLNRTQAMINGMAEPLDAAPFIIQNRTMVPIRFISESFGAHVDWKSDTQEVTITMLDKSIVLPLNSQTALVDNKPVFLDVPAQLMNNRTFIPLRFISENLGLHVDYHPETQSITIF